MPAAFIILPIIGLALFLCIARGVVRAWRGDWPAALLILVGALAGWAPWWLIDGPSIWNVLNVVAIISTGTVLITGILRRHRIWILASGVASLVTVGHVFFTGAPTVVRDILEIGSLTTICATPAWVAAALVATLTLIRERWAKSTHI